MKFINSFYTLIFLFAIVFASCKKEESVDPSSGVITLEIEHVWGSTESAFSLNKELLHPMLGDKMTFSTFKYYISNIRLQKSDNSWLSLNDTYFIADAGNTGNASITIQNVPGGNYTGIEMMFGVDSLQNVSGAQSGALSPSNGMFWTWTTGYIMVKAEGTSPSSLDGTFAFHLGGFKGDNKVQTKKEFGFGGTFVVDGDREAEIHLIANPARLWHGAEKLGVISNMQMPGALAKSMSGNFYDSIRFDHIHN